MPPTFRHRFVVGAHLHKANHLWLLHEQQSIKWVACTAESFAFVFMMRVKPIAVRAISLVRKRFHPCTHYHILQILKFNITCAYSRKMTAAFLKRGPIFLVDRYWYPNRFYTFRITCWVAFVLWRNVRFIIIDFHSHTAFERSVEPWIIKSV